MKQLMFLIGNPAAGRNASKKIQRAIDIIRSRGFYVQVLLTGKRGDAELFARRICSEFGGRNIPRCSPHVKGGQGEILVIAAGGDGTYNEIINGIAGADISMGILPLGTTNVLAKELNISGNLEEALDIALSGRAQKVCLGKITFSKPGLNSGFSARFFLLMAGIGYDGETVYGTNSKIKQYSGRGAYILSGLKTLLGWNPEKLVFKIDGKTSEGYSAIICNASKYAGIFSVAPEARLNEPKLYAFIMHGRRRLDIIRYVSGIITQRHLKSNDITYQGAEKIEINGNAHIQIDGDYLGKTPASIEIVPEALRLVLVN